MTLCHPSFMPATSSFPDEMQPVHCHSTHYSSYGALSRTSSTNSSPASYSVSEPGEDPSHTMAIKKGATTGHRYSPYQLPSMFVTSPPSASYASPSTPGLDFVQSHGHRPRGPRQSSYGYSSRSHSRSVSPSPALSPFPRHASLNSLAVASGQPGNSIYQYSQSQTQAAQAPPSPLPLPIPSSGAVQYPSQYLPAPPPHTHHSLARFQAAGWLDRLAASTKDSLTRPYRNALEHEKPFGILPKAVLDRILGNLDYLSLLRARRVSKTCDRIIDPQIADLGEKIAFVCEMESKARNCRPRQGADGGKGAREGIPSKVGCYFCFSIKDASMFQAPGQQRHWAIVYTDRHTGKVRYEGLSDEEENAVGGLSRRARFVDGAVGAEGYGAQGQHLPPLPQQQWQGLHPQHAQHGYYSQYASPPAATYSHPHQTPQHQYFHQHPQQQQQQLPQPSQEERGSKISLRRYCIECGVKEGLYESRAVFRDWTERRKLWVCECSSVNPVDRIHDQETEDVCSTCGVRASYR